MQASVVDSIKARMSQTATLRDLNQRKQYTARLLLAMCNASLLIMCAEVELCLRGASHAWTDGMKTLNVVILILMIGASVVYHRTDFKSEQMTGHTRSGCLENLYPIFECLVLLIGVIPPFVRVTFNKGHLQLPGGEDEILQSGRAPIDVLGVLMFYARMPLLFKWWVTSFVMSSPSYIAWLYSVHVGPTFRFKYLFTLYPVRIIVLSFMMAWGAGTFCLRAFEFDLDDESSVHHLQTWLFVSYGFSAPSPARASTSGPDSGPALTQLSLSLFPAC